MDRMDEVRSFIKDNIDYDGLLQCHPTEKMDINELVELMVETIIFHLLFLFEGQEGTPASRFKGIAANMIL